MARGVGHAAFMVLVYDTASNELGSVINIELVEYSQDIEKDLR